MQQNGSVTTQRGQEETPRAGGGGRILMVANRLPYPLNDGWKRRTYHLLRALAARRPVTLASLHEGEASAVAELAERLEGAVRIETVRPPLLRGPTSIGLGLVTSLPYHVWRQRSRALAALVRRVAAEERPKIAIATLVHLYPYIRALRSGTLRVIDTHNIDSLVLRRYADSMWRGPRAAYARMTARKLERHERGAMADADRVWVCSETERQLLASIAGNRVEVVPNGVDAFGEFASRHVPTEPKRLIFFGKMDYHPNADGVAFFLDEVLPRIREAEPDVEFVVTGPGTPDELRKRAAADASTRICGWVEDLAAEVSSAAVAVVPLRAGGGTRLKILEALALGRPVVSTHVGAEGLDLEDGRDLLLEDAPERFAAAVVTLLRDRARAAALGSAGRDAVRAKYDWGRIGERVADSLGIETPVTR